MNAYIPAKFYRIPIDCFPNHAISHFAFESHKNIVITSAKTDIYTIMAIFPKSLYGLVALLMTIGSV